jgi:DNA-binding LacI/PurR family transcriptional regulator
MVKNRFSDAGQQGSPLSEGRVRASTQASEQQPRRATINDIAQRAGVSKGAVSYALNGRPGVSDETRDRILAIADELGWYPNRAARALSASRADALGLVLARPATTIALEPFFMEFIAGGETQLSARSIGLTLQLVRSVEEEVEVYRRWYGEHRVDGVFLVDMRRDDPRIDALAELGLPAVVIGGPLSDGRLPSVWHDEASAVVEALQYVAALGHRRVARVAGVPEFIHTDDRTQAFWATVHELGLEAQVVATDYTAKSGARATRRLLSSASPPTAVIFDSDLLAVTGLGVAQQMGFAIPDDLSIVGWDDSLISQVVHPPLTAITRDIEQFGASAATHLLGIVDGSVSGDVEVPRGELTPRGSTAPPRLDEDASASPRRSAPARRRAASGR